MIGYWDSTSQECGFRVGSGWAYYRAEGNGKAFCFYP